MLVHVHCTNVYTTLYTLYVMYKISTAYSTVFMYTIAAIRITNLGRVIRCVCECLCVGVSVLQKENGLSYRYQTWYRRSPWQLLAVLRNDIKKSKVKVTRL